MKRVLRLGTRGSALALAQATEVQAFLEKTSEDLSVQIEIIKTTGDKMVDVPLIQMGGKGIFIKEIEEALLEKKIDIAVHSLKDLPTDQPKGLHVSAVLEREDPRDCLISRFGEQLMELPRGALVGTSSLRRQAQIKAALTGKRVSVVDIRGNLDTRIRKVMEGDVSSVVVACAGVNRLKRQEEVSEVISFERILPAPAQGCVAVESRVEDQAVFEILKKINHEPSFRAAQAERDFLGSLGGGCRVPIGAYAREEENNFILDGLVISSDGKRKIKKRISGSFDRYSVLGKELGEIMLREGARDILGDVTGVR